MHRLALFDLDHTLIPIDSDYEWGRFLARLGVVDLDHYESRNREFYEHYKAGTLDVFAFLAFSLAAIAHRPAAQIEGWRTRYMDEVITPAILPQARRLVDEHRARGDLCAVVTATNTFVTAPIAAAFGIDHLVGTEAERIDGVYTGKPSGVPSFREGKVVRTADWLASLGRGWDDFDEVWFYSDSSNDLPLLERASHPVATNPDPDLRTLATERAWRVIDLFEPAR